MAKTKEIPPGVPAGDTGAPLGEPVKPPKFATTTVADAHGEIPRVVSPLERAPRDAGLARFRVSCHNFQPKNVRYILAESADEAERHYLKVEGLEAEIARLKKRGGEVENPDLVTVRMPD